MMGHAWVYIMLRADGLRKLGCSADVTSRRAQLIFQTGIKHVLETSWKMPDGEARMTERLAHLRLKELRATDCNSIECYPLSRAHLRDVVLWAIGAAKALCAEGAPPEELADQQIIEIASNGSIPALLQQAKRGQMTWKAMVRRAQDNVPDDTPEEIAEKLIKDFHAFCFPPPGQLVRREGRFVFLSPGTDLHERRISRERLERLIYRSM